MDNKKDLRQVLFGTIYCKFYYFCNELPLVIIHVPVKVIIFRAVTKGRATDFPWLLQI